MTKYIEKEIPYCILNPESANRIYCTIEMYTQIADYRLFKENTIYVIVESVEVEE